MDSTLEAPTHTLADGIPLGRRIKELKKEKGGRYSTNAMSKRIGLSEPTFRQMLNSQRVIYTFELDTIAKDLKIPVARILQMDISGEVEDLSYMLKNLNAPRKALDIALKLSENAMGLSERCHALHRLGRAFFNSFRFEESNSVLVEAHQLALEIKRLYAETDTLYNVLFHLMDSFTAKHDFETASRILDDIRPYFKVTPTRYSAISYQKSKIEESKGNIPVAKRFAKESLMYAEETEKPVLIAKARVNLAHFEFLTMDHHRSSELLELAITGLEEDVTTRLIARKELVKSLLKLDLKDQAISQIEIALEEATKIGWQDMIGKLTILMTVSTGQPRHAQAILDNVGNSLKIRYLACRCLQSHYMQAGDGAKVLLYHGIAETICVDFSDFLNVGEL